MGMGGSGGSGRGRGGRGVIAEINVTPLVDVMLVLLIIFMVAAGVQTIELESERQLALDRVEDKLEEAENLLAEFEQKRQQHTRVDIDLPRVAAEPVHLSEVKKLKLSVDERLRFTIDGALLVDCLEVSPPMAAYLGPQRDASRPDDEDAAFSPCLKALGEKLVDNPRLREEKEIYVLASRTLHYGQVLRVMAAVRQSGVTKFGLVAEPGILGEATVAPTPPAVP
jgi:biopolymer transport protein ExbD